MKTKIKEAHALLFIIPRTKRARQTILKKTKKDNKKVKTDRPLTTRETQVRSGLNGRNSVYTEHYTRPLTQPRVLQ